MSYYVKHPIRKNVVRVDGRKFFACVYIERFPFPDGLPCDLDTVSQDPTTFNDTTLYCRLHIDKIRTTN